MPLNLSIILKQVSYKFKIINIMLAIKVPVIESERGWGSKIDDYMVCLTLEDAKKFVKKFNSRNTEKSTPDWYMRAEENFIPIDISDSQLTYIQSTDNQRAWFSSLKKK